MGEGRQLVTRIIHTDNNVNSGTSEGVDLSPEDSCPRHRIRRDVRGYRPCLES